MCDHFFLFHILLQSEQEPVDLKLFSTAISAPSPQFKIHLPPYAFSWSEKIDCPYLNVKLPMCLRHRVKLPGIKVKLAYVSYTGESVPISNIHTDLERDSVTKINADLYSIILRLFFAFFQKGPVLKRFGYSPASESIWKIF